MTIFKDNDGTTNPTLLLAFALVFASIGWVSFLVYKNHNLPDLTGIAYLLGGSGAMNIAHKAEDIIASIRKGPTDGGK